MPSVKCPALVISAPSSGQGKTTIAAGLAYYHRQAGKKVRVFKVGPDFLDPMILEKASGNPVYHLDLWMTGIDDCHKKLYEAAQDADLIIVEGVMGLYDGSGSNGNSNSTADLATKFNLPTIAVINASAMAQTFQAIAHGLATFKPNLNFAGVIANNVGSAKHIQMLSSNMSFKLLAAFPRNEDMTLGSRHLGLVQANEVEDLEQKLKVISDLVARTELAAFLPEVEFADSPDTHSLLSKTLAEIKIGIACDEAFSFLYQANVDLLSKLGAKVEYFSPLKDSVLPEVDSLYFPGGYPELHLQTLENNLPMKKAIHKHFENKKSIYVECGGLLYMLESLTDKNGKSGKMLGLIPGHAIMQSRLANLSYQEIDFGQGKLRGHTFHYSKASINLDPVAFSKSLYLDQQSEGAYVLNGLKASYIHAYFPSNPQAVASLFAPLTNIKV